MPAIVHLRNSVAARVMVAAVSVSTLFGQSPVPPLWGNLEAGPYAAGYRAYFAFDATRAYGKPRGPRPILVNLWFPAVDTKGEAIAYREYLTPPALEGYSDFRNRLEGFLLDVLSEHLFGKKQTGLTAPERQFLDALLASPTHAWKEATPAPGRFPVILYHPGADQSYANNSTICEYLASHGYVVITSAFQSRDDRQAGDGEFEPETSWRDMAFLITHSRLLRQADLLNTGAFGYGAGAQYLLEWLGQRHPALGAAASLDATAGRETQQKDTAAQQKRLSRLDPQNLPVLITAPADLDQNFSVWDRYLPCHSEAAPAQLTTPDFVLHGWLARVFRHDHPAEIRGQYDRLAQVLLAFFDAKLKGSAATWQRLTGEARPGFRITPGACGGPG